MGVTKADFVNERNYVQQVNKRINGKSVRIWTCPYFLKWYAIKERSVTDSTFKERNPTYKDVTCCEDWLNFATFRKWMESQPWEGMDLDKDLLLPGNKVYSPEACVFIPKQINCMLGTGKRSARVERHPIGASYREKGNRFISQIANGDGSVKYLGCFEDPMEAHAAWQGAKAASIKAHVANWTVDRHTGIAMNCLRVANTLLEHKAKGVESDVSSSLIELLLD